MKVGTLTAETERINWNGSIREDSEHLGIS